MKNTSIKTKTFIALGAILLLSAAKPKPLNGPGNLKILADADTNRGIVARYSSFEVPVTANAIPLSTVLTSVDLKMNGKYGAACFLDFSMNNDNTIDAMWLTGSVASAYEKHLSRISLANQSLVKNFVIPNEAVVPNTRYLGYESLGNDMFVIGLSSTPDPVDGLIKDAYYTCFNGNTGAIKYTTKLWSDPTITYYDWVGQKSTPAQATTPILKYNKNRDVLGIMFGHKKYNGHQGGFISFIKASTGEIVTKTQNGTKTLIGSEWWYSHLMDSRLLASKSANTNYPFYTLSLGDAYPRDLAFNKFNETEGGVTGAVQLIANIPDGADNQTFIRIGDLLELPNGDVAVAYSTNIVSPTDVNGPKNIKMAIITGAQTATPTIKKTVDVTTYDVASNLSGGSGMQLALSGQNEILVGWNVFNYTTTVPTKTSFRLVDFDGNITSATEDINTPLLYHAQTMKHTGGANDRIVFVSTGTTDDKLKINIIGPETTLPVTLTKLEANVNANQLSVNWSTASELNNHHFEIETSNNGKDFKKVGQVDSKSEGGNSKTNIDYTFSTSAVGLLATLPLIIFAFTPAGASRRRKLLVLFAIGGFLIYGISCKKNDKVEVEKGQKIYVRLAQVDNNGTKQYSDVIIAKNQ